VSEASGDGRSFGSAWDTAKDDPAKWAQKRRLADAMRLVIERLVPSDAPEAELRAAAEGLEHYAEALRAHPRLRYAFGYGEAANAGDAGAFFDQSPMQVLANPLAPPVTISQTGERSALGRVTFGSAYEGPPGCVHGGFVAAAFDEVLGFVQSLSGKPGMTGSLTVRYRKPTPLHRELRIAAELVRVDKRRLFAEERLTADETRCADAEAVFISMGTALYEKLVAQRSQRDSERA
jgi:acyl-coenzyme A thioesterase PaaI-like protein